MLFLVYSDVGGGAVGDNLGMPEYSYYFVLRAFEPALKELGTVVTVKNPEREVDAFFDAALLRGEECVFLCFSPPYRAPIDLRCPTVCVFAWEFNNIPNEQWNDDPRCDWRFVFARHGGAIALSEHTASAVKDAMGQQFPVAAIPAPIWNLFRTTAGSVVESRATEIVLSIHGHVIDSRVLDLHRYRSLDELLPPLSETSMWPRRLVVTGQHLSAWYNEALSDLVPASLLALGGSLRSSCDTAIKRIRGRFSTANQSQLEPLTITLSGVVYTSVFNPTCGRKNWFDMVTAFCWAFRDNENATLILKMSHRQLQSFERKLYALLSELSPFRCRVIALHGYLDDTDYSRLIDATSFYVNTSHCEGLCLPLMEFMSGGKPALTPNHTAMADYIDEKVAFVVRSSEECDVWPQDPRELLRTLRFRISWRSLLNAYKDSYAMATQNPAAYRQMATSAATRMQQFCSVETVRAKLQVFLHDFSAAQKTHAKEKLRA